MVELSAKEKRYLEEWGQLGLHVRDLADQPASTAEAQKLERKKKRLQRHYYKFFEEFFPAYKKYPFAGFHGEMASTIEDHPHLRYVVEGFRGSAKSTHAGMGIPLWLMAKGELEFMIVVSDTKDKAEQLLNRIQRQILNNQVFRKLFKATPKYGSFTKDSFIVQVGNQEVAFRAIGIGESPRGQVFEHLRPDFILIDDADTAKRCKNPLLVAEAVKWVTEDLQGCFDPERQRMVVTNSRVDDVSILTGLQSKWADHSAYYYSLINALDENDESTWPEKFPTAYLRQERGDDPKFFAGERMNKPQKEGGTFSEGHIRYSLPLPDWREYDAVIAYMDPSFSTSENSDFTAIKHWAQKDLRKICLKAYVRRDETLDKALLWWHEYLESMPEPVRKKVKFICEGNAGQKDRVREAVTRLVERKGIHVKVTYDLRPKAEKADRISAMLATYEDRLAEYNALEQHNPDMQRAIRHLTTWNEDKKIEDDSPDADAGAWDYLDKYAKKKSASQGGFWKTFKKNLAR